MLEEADSVARALEQAGAGAGCNSRQPGKWPGDDRSLSKSIATTPLTTIVECAVWREGRPASREMLQAVLLNEREQLEGQPTRLFRASLPFLDGAFARVEVAGEHGLADVVRLAKLLDLSRFDWRRSRQLGFIELAHRRLADRSHAEHACSAAMDRLEGVALEFRFLLTANLQQSGDARPPRAYRLDGRTPASASVKVRIRQAVSSNGICVGPGPAITLPLSRSNMF